MRWQAAVFGALASAFIPTAAFAEVHSIDDPGVEVIAYVQKFHELREAGEHFVIDGACLSACTLFTGIIARDHVCVTPPRCARLPRRLVFRRRAAYAGAEPRGHAGALAPLPAG